MDNGEKVLKEFGGFHFDPFDNDYENEEIYDLDFLLEEKKLEEAADRWVRKMNARSEKKFVATAKRKVESDFDPMDSNGDDEVTYTFDW
jgi:hypothetical protein